MKTSDEIQVELAACVDEKTYDALAKELEVTRKYETLQRAKDAHAMRERAAAELQARRTAHAATVAAVDGVYGEIERLDREMYNAGVKFYAALRKRLDLSEQVRPQEVEALEAGRELGIRYDPRTPALIGGQPLTVRENALIKIWFQRLTMWWKRYGGKPTLEQVASQGLAGSTEAEDLPNVF